MLSERHGTYLVGDAGELHIVRAQRKHGRPELLQTRAYCEAAS